MENKKTVALIIPSAMVSKGLEDILDESGEFKVEECFRDISRPVEARLGTLDPDVVIIDPSVLDFRSRKDGRSRLADICDSIVIALGGPGLTDEVLRQYDGSISIYDSREDILRKTRSSVEAKQSETSVSDSGELSAREKEILVCVAKGMLNKEIAFKYNISIFTVMTHRKNISAKTGIKSIAGLTAYAILQGMIDIEDIK